MEHDLYIYLLLIDDSEKQLINLVNFATNDFRDYIDIQGVVKNKQHLYSEIMAKYFGSIIKNTYYNYLIINKTAFGKPYFANCNLQYNVSHSNNLVAIAFSKSIIGIDIEKIQNCDSNIVAKLYSNKEKEYVYKCPVNQAKRFIEVWTRKEAYIKYLGKSINMQVGKLCVFKRGIYKRTTTIFSESYILSIHCQKRIKSIYLSKLNEKDLLDKLNQIVM